MEIKIKEFLRRNEKSMEFVQNLSELKETEVNIRVGNRVMYTNERGYEFGPYNVIAISKSTELWKYGNCIFLDKDSYWYPVRPESIKVVG